MKRLVPAMARVRSRFALGDLVPFGKSFPIEPGGPDAGFEL
jgi:hypothetical protein